MPFEKRAPAPKSPSRFDTMEDAAFLEWLQDQKRVESADYNAVQNRVNALKGALYEQASRLLMSRTGYQD